MQQIRSRKERNKKVKRQKRNVNNIKGTNIKIKQRQNERE